MITNPPRVHVPDPEGPAQDATGGLTRTGLFKLLAGSAAGAAGIGLLAAPGASAAVAPGAQVDVTVLQYALTLEYLGATFYEDALRHAKLRGDAHEAAVAFRWHERRHVVFVQDVLKSLGATPHPAETFDFGASVRSQQAFLETSARIEEMCVETLNGAGPLVSKPVLAGAGTLVSVEARQASWVLDILGRDPAPFAFNPALTPAQSMARLKRLGFVTEEN